MVPVIVVDCDSVIENYRFLAGLAKPAEMSAVVKANAYGLGMETLSKELYDDGCRTFFVAHFGEALPLRKKVGDAEIIVMHGFSESDFKTAAAHGITPMLNDLGAVEAWRRFARQTGAEAPCCIHLDTSMNRLGLSAAEQEKLANDHALIEGLKIRAWVSHFACAEEFDNPLTPEQRDRFVAITRRLPSAPLSLCNSSGLFWGKDFVFDLVRPGIALYGGNPTPHLPNPMRSVVELHAPILQVRDVVPDMTVGYGGSHRVARKGRVATLSLGYADGYHRALGGKGEVMFGSFPAPVVGRVSMDLITVDVTDVPESVAQVGAMAVVIGPHRTVDQVALEAETIPYEILTSLSPRIERTYRIKEKAA